MGATVRAMKRLKRILAAAAGLVVTGGLALGVALQQANLADPDPMTCAEWKQAIERVGSGDWGTMFVAVEQGYTLPTAVESPNRVLGECAGGECVIEPQGCPVPFTYEYRVSSLVNGWRLAEVRAPL